MDDKKLPVAGGTRNLITPTKSNEDRVKFVTDNFRVGETIDHLYLMMKKVTEKEYSPQTINAACNCIARMNETINTTIQAARFIGQNDR